MKFFQLAGFAFETEAWKGNLEIAVVLHCFLASIQNGTVNVTGLPGQKGQQGIQGITGAQGDTGQNGTQGQVSHPF